MAIQAPKTDWVYEDVINYWDFQRIYDNQQYIIGRMVERLGIDEFNIHASGLNSYVALGYVYEINYIEENLRTLIEKAGQTALGYTIKTWPIEDENPNFEDANRWESTIQAIKVTVYYTSIYIPRCGVPNCGQVRLWQNRFRNPAGLMWKEFEEYDMDWDYFDSLDEEWIEFDYQPL